MSILTFLTSMVGLLILKTRFILMNAMEWILLRPCLTGSLALYLIEMVKPLTHQLM
jgi:hypothetical protein